MKTGDTFGKLTVLSLLPGKRRVHTRAQVQCDCGTMLIVRRGDLRDGNTKSCGCSRRGSESPSWKANDVGYHAIHGRLKIGRGPAKENDCSLCEEQAAHWAYMHDCIDERLDATRGPFCLHPEHYFALCAMCHKGYDKDEGALVRLLDEDRSGIFTVPLETRCSTTTKR